MTAEKEFDNLMNSVSINQQRMTPQTKQVKIPQNVPLFQDEKNKINHQKPFEYELPIRFPKGLYEFPVFEDEKDLGKNRNPECCYDCFNKFKVHVKIFFQMYEGNFTSELNFNFESSLEKLLYCTQQNCIDKQNLMILNRKKKISDLRKNQYHNNTSLLECKSCKFKTSFKKKFYEAFS